MKISRSRNAATAAVLSAAFAVTGAGCGTSEPAQPAGRAPVVLDAPPPAVRRGNSAPNGATRQQAFLARIKNAARSNGVIRDARMNGDRELGIVFGPSVKLKQIRPLMTTVLREMREEFPNRSLTVIGYAPNGQEMATMRYNPQAPANANVTFTTAPGLR